MRAEGRRRGAGGDPKNGPPRAPRNTFIFCSRTCRQRYSLSHLPTLERGGFASSPRSRVRRRDARPSSSRSLSQGIKGRSTDDRVEERYPVHSCASFTLPSTIPIRGPNGMRSYAPALWTRNENIFFAPLLQRYRINFIIEKYRVQ